MHHNRCSEDQNPGMSGAMPLVAGITLTHFVLSHSDRRKAAYFLQPANAGQLASTCGWHQQVRDRQARG
jgi:hypothetical protein